MGALVVLMMLGGAFVVLTIVLALAGLVTAVVFALRTKHVPGRVRWPTTLGVALFPLSYLFLVLFAWYGAYNALCELRDVPIVGTAEAVTLNGASRLAREDSGQVTVTVRFGDETPTLYGLQTLGYTDTLVYGTKDAEYSDPTRVWFLFDPRAGAVQTFPDEPAFTAAARAAGLETPATSDPAALYPRLRRVWIDYIFLAAEVVALLAVLVGWVRFVESVRTRVRS